MAAASADQEEHHHHHHHHGVPNVEYASNVPTYVIDLDLPPAQRWAQVVHDYIGLIPDVINDIQELAGEGTAASLAQSLLSFVTNRNAVLYAEELKALADLANLPLGLVVMLQLAYEAYACCTSIVTMDGYPGWWKNATCSVCKRDFNVEPEGSEEKGKCAHTGTWHDSFGSCGPSCLAGIGIKNVGKCHWSCCYSLESDPLGPCPQSGCHLATFPDTAVPIHIRTMDWDLPKLKKLTINVAYTRKGVTVFRATTWAGYIGVLTGMRVDGYTVSINFRRTGSPSSLLINLWNTITYCWPVGYLVREVLDSTSKFDDAVAAFATSPLVAPVYITIAGILPGQGIRLTRDRNGDTRRWDIRSHGPIIQTNVDHWHHDGTGKFEDICYSIDRYNAAVRRLKTKPAVPLLTLFSLTAKRWT